jgi:hypothetical protein
MLPLSLLLLLMMMHANSYSIIVNIYIYIIVIISAQEVVQKNEHDFPPSCDQLAHSPAFQVTVASLPPVAKRVQQALPVEVSTWTNTRRAPVDVLGDM